MQRYDQDRSRRGPAYGFAHGYATRRPARGYGGSDYYGGWETTWGRTPSAGFQQHGTGLYRQWGTPAQAPGYGAEYGGRYDRGFARRPTAGGHAGGYDRGVYGSRYPSYGGYPGGPRQGTYYGGRGYDLGYEARYDAGYGGARQTFMPEEAYRRHPEYDRPQQQRGGRWPAGGHDLDARDVEISDEEVEGAVREALESDHWIEAERVEVEVRDGVVTLTGEVDDYLEARYAWDDAWESAGVRGVVNQLTVRVDRE